MRRSSGPRAIRPAPAAVVKSGRIFRRCRSDDESLPDICRRLDPRLAVIGDGRMPAAACCKAQADEPARRAVERTARDSYARLIAFLSARSRDVAAAEDALADAFRAALEAWPNTGVPEKPEAWLLTSA